MNKKIMATTLACTTFALGLTLSSVASASAVFEGGRQADVFSSDFLVAADQNRTQEELDALKLASKAKAKNEVKSNKKSQTEVKTRLPITIYGDDLKYDSGSGEFSASGNVRMYQGTQVLKTQSASGNIKTGDVLLNKGVLIKDEKGETKASWAKYNFNTKNGELKKISGSSNYDIFNAQHALIKNGQIDLDQGAMTTRCPAKEHPPCVSIRADRVKIYPNEKIVAYNVRVYVGSVHIYSRDKWVNEINGGKQTLVPSIGYETEHGWEIKYHLNYEIGDKDTFYLNPTYYSKIGYKPNYEFKHEEKNFYVNFKNGWYEDSDSNWIKKHVDYGVYYKPHYLLDEIPVKYSFFYTRGLWEDTSKNQKSWRTEYGMYLSHDSIYLGQGKNLYLNLGAGIKKLNYELGDGNKTVTSYNASINKKFNDKFNASVAYYWEKGEYDIFAYSKPDMAHEIRTTAKIKFDDKNSLLYINRWDEGNGKLYSNIYRLTHDFCCWRFYVQYEDRETSDKDDKWSVKYDLFRW